MKRKHGDADCLTIRSKRMRILPEGDEQNNRNQSIKESTGGRPTNGKVQERPEVIGGERSNESNEPEQVQKELGDCFGETSNRYQIKMSADNIQGDAPQHVQIDRQNELSQYNSSTPADHDGEQTNVKLKSQRPKGEQEVFLKPFSKIIF